MKIRPIIYSTPMIQALLDGRKTKTRRVIKPQPETEHEINFPSEVKNNGFWKPENVGKWIWPTKDGEFFNFSPYGKPGDMLWVREVFFYNGDDIVYRADGTCCQQFEQCECSEIGKPKWKSPLFMPRKAARIWLQIDDVSVERVQDISEEDAIAEGVNRMPHRCETSYPNDCHRCAFKILWNQINGPKGYSWNTNPWVWVIDFSILSTTGKPLDQQKQ